MKKRNSITIFLAATTALTLSTIEDFPLKAGENDYGGLKEWNTDMPIEADFILDDEAKRLADEAAASSMCIPIGEGENCW